MSVSEAEIEELRKLAEAATAASKSDDLMAWYSAGGLADFRQADRAFIAALNPATVLRILADREAAEEKMREAEGLLRGLAPVIRNPVDGRLWLAPTVETTIEWSDRRDAFLSTGKPSKAKETA